LRFHRRQLHVQNPTEGNVRKNYGGTLSMGFVRGSLVKHAKKGLAYIGGTMAGKISLHDTKTGKRIGQNFRPEHCKFLSFNTWRTLLLPAVNGEVSAAILG
jgi:biotin synthase-related radical SAM superfamily protein